MSTLAARTVQAGLDVKILAMNGRCCLTNTPCSTPRAIIVRDRAETVEAQFA